jgi:riboflavin synthase
MFTGIVSELGRVVGSDSRGELLIVRIAAPDTTSGLAAGDSVAVNGCCLTAVEVGAGVFRTELTPETLRRTAFGERLAAGARVNLERPLRADGRFDGHIVQGHVDGVCRVRRVDHLGDSAELSLELPGELSRYLVEKGSVAVDGVSLTVASLGDDGFAVALIPYTLEHTTLGGAAPGDLVNVEVDVVAKYVERLMGTRR